MAKKPERQEAEEGDLDILELEDNLSDVEKPPELPVGMYTAEIQDVQTAISQGKGNKYYAIRMQVPPDEIPADLRDDFPEGAVLSWNRQTVPKKGDRRSLYSLRRLIEAMGLDANVTTIDPNEWMGCSLRIKVRHKPYEGEMRAEIGSIEAAEAQPRATANGRRNAKTEEPDEEDGEAEAAPRGRPAGRGAGAKPGRRAAR